MWRAMQDGVNLFQGWRGGRGGLADAFLAGILAHLPALQAFTVPTPIGYERMKPGVGVRCMCSRLSEHGTAPSPFLVACCNESMLLHWLACNLLQSARARLHAKRAVGLLSGGESGVGCRGH